MCSDPSHYDKSLLTNGSQRYRYSSKHPMNRYPEFIRDRVERQLDFTLRADPSGDFGGSVCRVYSPEINTQEKLHNALQKALDLDGSFTCNLSGSTLHRMVNEYLKRKNYKKISFTQSDHNACPTCKTLEYSVLTHYYEANVMEGELSQLKNPVQPLSDEKKRRLAFLTEEVKNRRFLEGECDAELRVHNDRDKTIRKFVKELADYFRDEEISYQTRLQRMPTAERRELESLPVSWNSAPHRACMTHQDDMTKVDLPHFVIEASSDITRWRFDVNAHVSAVTNDAIVFSHEQGTGPKNASAIVEGILLDHLLSCKGEGIKVVVSDNASVGKNWLTTIALPAYLVDQGLAEIALIVFLENNHGKWLADMLFGQFQSRRKRTVIVGIDDMLSGFESIRRRRGKGAKDRLPDKLKSLLGPALPDEVGMVRISTKPPTNTPQNKLPYEDRYLDVPSAHPSTWSRSAEISNTPSTRVTRTEILECVDEHSVPLVVELTKAYSGSGNYVVSNRTAGHVGYNGFGFRKMKACPELRDKSKALVRRAWPRGLIEYSGDRSESEEPIQGSERVKCAPLNWIVRRPVAHFCESDLDWKARYPPRNLLNAKYEKGSRVPEPWVPTATYDEPSFPIMPCAASREAFLRFSAKHTDLGESLHVLQVLEAVFQDMKGREGVVDRCLHKSATRASVECINKYDKELRIYAQREKNRPRAARSVRQVFKEDPKVLEDVERVIREKGVTGAAQRKLKGQELNMRFSKAEATPGGLDRFEYLAEKDLERYARELKQFKENQKEFDRRHGLLPLE